MITVPQLALVVGFLASHDQESATVHYRIRPVPTVDRTDLEIEVRFRAEDGRPQVVKLPTDSYGTPDLFRFVTTFDGATGTVVRPGSLADERIVEPGADGGIALKYVLSYDPQVMDGVSFGPNIGPTHFHCAGCQWLLRIGDLAQRRPFVVEMADAPETWHLYSSLGPDPRRAEVLASYEELVATAIGGGAGACEQFMVQSKPTSVFIQGSFSIPNAEIFLAVRRIVALEREWFQDFAQPFYVVTILPRSGIVAGTCVQNLFVCFTKPDVTRNELNVLLAHEMFHTWLPNKLSIRLEKGESDLKHEWFSEGFTDLLARRILMDAGLLTPGRFAELVNKDIVNLADNPHRQATYAELLAAARGGSYTTAWKKLAYYRGALLALNWNDQLRESAAGEDLGDLIKELYRLASENGGTLTEHAFYDAAADFGVDAEGDFERHIVRGEPIEARPGALGPDFERFETTGPSFEPGFSLDQTFKSRQVSGVVDGGAAELAGLRNGMELVRIQNSNRFGNGWDPDQPLVVVTRDDGKERRFEFLPRGPALRLKLFRAKGGAR